MTALTYTCPHCGQEKTLPPMPTLQGQSFDKPYAPFAPAERPDAGPVVLTASIAKRWCDWADEQGVAPQFLELDDALRALASGQTVCVPAGGAVADVVAERERQISGEHWTRAHDDVDHYDGALAQAAAAYACVDHMPGYAKKLWPFDAFKPKDARSNAVRAAALLIAEIERLDRADAARTSAQEKK